MTSYNLGLIFIILSNISINNDNTVFTELKAEVWEHSDLTTMKSDRSINTNSQTFTHIGSKPTG